MYILGLVMEKAKLFKNGQSQAVRLPKAYRFDGQEVIIRKIGETVMLTPIHEVWNEFRQSINDFSADYLSDREQPALQDRDSAFE